MSLRLLFEVVVGVIVAAGVVSVTDSWGPNDIRTAASTFSSLAGTLLGFVITALSILLALGSSVLLQNLRRTGHLQDLHADLFLTGGYFGLALLLALIPVFANQHSMIFPLAASVGAFAAALIRTLRAGHRFYLVVTNV